MLRSTPSCRRRRNGARLCSASRADFAKPTTMASAAWLTPPLQPEFNPLQPNRKGDMVKSGLSVGFAHDRGGRRPASDGSTAVKTRKGNGIRSRRRNNPYTDENPALHVRDEPGAGEAKPGSRHRSRGRARKIGKTQSSLIQ